MIVPIFYISRDRMVDLVDRRISYYKIKLDNWRPGQRPYTGAYERLACAIHLMERLTHGGLASPHEVAAYFGAWARMRGAE